jgi:hypothetical protein
VANKSSMKRALISIAALAGAVVVLILVAYPNWQEYRERQRADAELKDLAKVKPLDLNSGSYPK